MPRTAIATLAVLTLALAGCSSASHEDHATSTSTAASASATPMDHSTIDHSGSYPADMVAATASRFPVGTAVTIDADHMPGMKGAKGTVAAAFATTTYAVTYTPTTGGAQVTDHKWVVAEELEGRPRTPLAKGTAVVITADHMPGMKGAKGTVTQVVTTPVHAVNYTPTTGGPMVHDHMWVTEDELRRA